MSSPSPDAINWDALQAASAGARPFPHLIASDILNPGLADSVSRDFPQIENPGSFPCETLQYGPAFARLLADIRGDRMRDLVAEKLGLNLAESKTMVTVRGAMPVHRRENPHRLQRQTGHRPDLYERLVGIPGGAAAPAKRT